LRHGFNLVTIGWYSFQVETTPATLGALMFARMCSDCRSKYAPFAARAAWYRPARAIAVNWSETGVLEERAPELDKFTIRYVGRQGPGPW
jgi:hypothetical protein